MGAVDYIVIAVILAILGFSAWYVYKSKKSGRKCIGCPDGSFCASSGCGGCSCGCGKEE